MPSTVVTVQHEAGLHARPLAKFVKLAKGFDARIEVANLTRGNGPVNGTSPIKLMLLAVLQGHQIEISSEGPQADEALQALTDLVANNFEGGE
jgi:phosphotransferase system HPr (HPr) family protein